MEPVSELAADAAETHGEHYHGPGAPGLELMAELGMIETLEAIKAHLGADLPDPQLHKVFLSANGDGQGRGNPAAAVGYFARSVWIANPNAFDVYVGAGAGTGTLERKLFSVPQKTWMVVPIADELYSIGTLAANLAGGDALVLVVRFADVQSPASGAISP